MVTLIIPVYNTPKELIKRCIESVQAQIYSGWKVIMIDDGSTKDIAQAMDEIAACDCRINVIHQANAGVSSARNIALKCVKDGYIGFIDSDDTVMPNYLQEAVEYIEKFDLDIVIGGASFISDSQNITACVNLPAEENIKIYENKDLDYVTMQMLEDKNIADAEELTECRNGGPCWRLYKKNIVENLEFCTDIFVLEDKIFNMYAFIKAKRIGVCKDLWYNYYQYDASALHRYQSHLADNCTAIISCCQIVMPKVSDKLAQSIQRFEVAQLSMLLQNAICHPMNECKFSERIKQISTVSNSSVWISAFKNIKRDELPFKKKVLCGLLLHRANILLWLVTKLFQINYSFRKRG